MNKGRAVEADPCQRLGIEGVSRHIRHIGLFNSKAKNVVATCEILLKDYGGEVPRDRKALEALPGVGRKTANVVLNTAFGEPTLAVDTHIFRLANRIPLAKGKTVRAVEDGLLRHIPQAYLKDAHHQLILHGRYVCTARKPRGGACVLFDLCEFKGRFAAAETPARRPGRPAGGTLTSRRNVPGAQAEADETNETLRIFLIVCAVILKVTTASS